MDALYFDEMKLSYTNRKKGYTLKGWVPSDWVPGEKVRYSLLLVVSPQYGVIYYILVKNEGVTGNHIYHFMQQMLPKFFEKYPWKNRNQPVPLILDNKRIHHTSQVSGYFDQVSEYFNGDEVKKHLKLTFLPPYSPFLNLCEEVFANLKARLWRRATTPGAPLPVNIDGVLKLMNEELQKITKEHIIGYQNYVQTFAYQCENEISVTSKSMYEDSHLGDEFRQCPKLPEGIEEVLKKYLPDDYSDYDPESESNRASHEILRKKVITMDDLQQVTTISHLKVQDEAADGDGIEL